MIDTLFALLVEHAEESGIILLLLIGNWWQYRDRERITKENTKLHDKLAENLKNEVDWFKEQERANRTRSSGGGQRRGS